jgi:RNA ligase
MENRPLIRSKDLPLLNSLDPLIANEIQEGHITCRPHPELDLFVLNYAPSVAYERRWNAGTLVCRGLIVDGDGNVVSRPFKKFFNLGEHVSPELPDIPFGEPFTAYEKMDGSLGITYPTPNGLAISTRGSFESEQAVKGTQMLREQYVDALPLMDPELTYLFEIIYPENRIVVSYEGDELVLLGAIHTMTGNEVDPDDLRHLPFRQPQEWRPESVDDLSMDTRNFEGYVVKFLSGLRVKVKLDEYVRVHRLVCDLTPRRIWECLQRGDDIEETIKGAPDELHDELNGLVSGLREQFHDVCYDHHVVYNEMQLDNMNLRRDQAMEITGRCLGTDLRPSPFFCLLDGKNEQFEKLMWDLIRP